MKEAAKEEVAAARPELEASIRAWAESRIAVIEADVRKREQEEQEPVKKVGWGLLAYVLAHVGRRVGGKAIGNKAVAAP